MGSALLGCGLNDIKHRRNILSSLQATNAPLSVVETTLGVRFTIERLGSAANSVPLKTTATNWNERLAQKRSRAFAAGHTSTISMQTWIFLDQRDRLIDFEVGAQ